MKRPHLKFNHCSLFSAVLAILFFCVSISTASAENKVQVSLISEETAIKAGTPVRLGVLLDATEGWHTYYKEPGDAGLPTKLNWQLPEGFSASDIDWPEPLKIPEGDLITYGYIGKTLLPVTVSVPSNLSADSYNLTVTAQWLTCNQICIPESQTVSIELPVGNPELSAQANMFPSKEKQALTTVNDTNLFTLLVTLSFALLGGLVLNIMPCVLPVLSLKTLALVKKSGHKRAHTAKYGIAYTLGILISFASVAAMLIALQQAGEVIGWGFQMQSPVFIGFMVFLLFLIGLNLSGFFYVPVILGGVGNNINENTVSGSFFTGILATLVAAPCTAPFMASAVGASLTMPSWAAMLVFLTLGFGLALPFLLISIFPSLLRFLPKQGVWMEKFKEFLAFPMYLSVIWLLWVLGKQSGINAVAMAMCGLLLIVFMLWLNRAVKNSNIFHHLFSILAVAIMLITILFSLNGKNQLQVDDTVYYSKSFLAQLRAEGKAVYVDATAAWCITCQLNKHAVLDKPSIKQLFKDKNIIFMVADWTNQNPEITELLHSFGYNGIPLNVFYPAGGGEPVVLPQLLSEEVVVKTVSN